MQVGYNSQSLSATRMQVPQKTRFSGGAEPGDADELFRDIIETMGHSVARREEAIKADPVEIKRREFLNRVILPASASAPVMTGKNLLEVIYGVTQASFMGTPITCRALIKSIDRPYRKAISQALKEAKKLGLIMTLGYPSPKQIWQGLKEEGVWTVFKGLIRNLPKLYNGGIPIITERGAELATDNAIRVVEF